MLRPARIPKNGSGGSFVNAAGFHTHETVFNDIDTADSVLFSHGIEFTHDVGRGVFFAVDLFGDTLFKGDDDIFGLIGGFGEGLGHNGDIFGEFLPGIFQHAAFKTDMEQVAVHAVRLFGGNVHGDIVFLGVFDHILTAFEVPVGVAPCGDDLDFGGDGVGVQFKAHLIVALAGSTVADGIGTFGSGDFDQTFGDEGGGRWKCRADSCFRRWLHPEAWGR